MPQEVIQQGSTRQQTTKPDKYSISTTEALREGYSVPEPVPEAVVKERFDRLLKEVQEISSEVCGRDLHTIQKVLVEMPDDHKEGYVTGRLSNNTVVHFPGDESLIGKIVDVWLEESKGFYYMGKQVEGQES